ncbi:MAG: peptide deformylase [Candidatus Midichloriaceae bacterium]|jgi:peptide deformylase
MNIGFYSVFVLFFMTLNCETAKSSVAQDNKVYLGTNSVLEVKKGKKVFKTEFENNTNTLGIIKEPDGNDKLREKSIKINEDSIPLTIEFMKNILLPTMYKKSGIGIAAIQVGLPINAFIVDIPITKVLVNDKYEEGDISNAVKEKLYSGQSVIIKELSPIYRNNKRIIVEKFVKKSPVMVEKNGKKLLDNIDNEILIIRELLPTYENSENFSVENITTKSSSPDQKDNIVADVISERKPYFVINPKITFESDEEIVLSEGCLSVPHDYVKKEYDGKTDVKRPLSIKLEYIDENNTKQKLNIDGAKNDYWKWFSRCTQHEFDHTEGVLFIDKLYTAGR